MSRHSFYTLILLTPFLTSCYCFHNVSGRSSVRDLETTKSFSLCDHWAGDGKTTSATPYYGFPSTDRLEHLKLREKISGDEMSITSETFGVAGINAHHWIAPGKFFPFRILGVGMDYSYNQNKITLADPYIEPEIHYQTNQRIMMSANLMTLVKRRLIGYGTLQGGLLHQRNSESSEILSNELGSGFKASFAYRAGYGIQYYPSKYFGINLEAGYGGGAYVRAGLIFWVF
jgi:hypothetical protein